MLPVIYRFAVIGAVVLGFDLSGCRRASGAHISEGDKLGNVVPLASRFGKGEEFATILPTVKAPQGVNSARAADCGRCHAEFYREWQYSTHAWALRDIQYQAELFKPDTPRWLCLNCHIPVENQRQQIVLGLEEGSVLKPILAKNDKYDPEMRDEAVTCAVCHIRSDAQGKSYVIGPFGNTDPLHPVKEDRAFLRRICLRCHDPKTIRITETFVCSFTTRKEVEKGPYAGKKDCVDCHLPRTKRKLVQGLPGYPEREVHQHHWVGGGVPKSYDLYAGLVERGFKPGLDVRLDKWSISKGGRAVEFALELSNARAGHWLPTSDPERYILALAYVGDEQERRFHEVSLRISQTWKWWPRAEKTDDNRLKPKEKRIWNASLSLPAEVDGLKLTILVYHVRLQKSAAAHMKETPVKDTYVPGVSALARDIEKHYPMASIVYREQVVLKTGERRVSSLAELIELAEKERYKSLKERDY